MGKQNKIMCYSIVNLHSNPLIYCWVLYLYVYTIHLFLSRAMLSRSELKLFFQKHVFFCSLSTAWKVSLYMSISLYLPLIIFSPISLPNCMYFVCSTICSLTSMKIVYISIYFNNLTFPLLDACWLKSMEMDLVKRKFCVFSTHAVMLFEASMKSQHICINYFLWTITHSSFKKTTLYNC